MQAGGCILHVRDGELREVPVRKTRMPRDPAAHYQGLALIRAPGGALYADEILTFVGSCYGDVDAGWHTATGNSDFCLIRWRPV